MTSTSARNRQWATEGTILQYRRELDQRIASYVPQHNSAAVIFSKMRGAFPSDVIGCEAGRTLTSTDVKPPNVGVSVYCPHLHPLSYEWYFTA